MQEWFITSTALSQQSSRLMVNSTSFNFMRASTQNVSPLVSSLLIIPGSDAINGTEITCNEIAGIVVTMSSTVTIIITGDSITGKIRLSYICVTVHALT